MPLILEKHRERSAFSVSKRNIHELCLYIENQPEHHKTKTFSEECEGYVKFYQQTIIKKKDENNRIQT
jgi:hypothetical protein